MKRKYIVVTLLIIVALIILCFSLKNVCTYVMINLLYNDLGNSNWKVQLNYGYAIQQISGDDIILVKDGWQPTNNIVISTKILSYCYDSQYAGFICVNDEDHSLESQGKKDNPCFYLLDMQHDILFGPFDESDFYKYCINNEVSLYIHWTKTSPRPDEATFN